VLGGGSNVLASDAGFAGLIIRPQIGGIDFIETADGSVEVVAGAGVGWDALVQACVERGLWGLENLAGIPGNVGAAPVQNIGAYGAELADTYIWCDALSRASGSSKRFAREEAQFSYRESIFKKEGEWIITRVALRLATVPKPNLVYADLMRAQKQGVLLTTPTEIAEAVRAIRSQKFPSLADWGTAGSFFKNPLIPSAAYAALERRYPGMPGFPSDGMVKVPLAWVLDHVLSLKGFKNGHVRLFEHQPLVLVTESGATANAVENFANEISEKVFSATGIKVEREVQSLK
jgi:UDP-N-acetylmuramate dehydrogenase